MLIRATISLVLSLLVVTNSVASEFNRYLLEVDPGEQENILAELKDRDDILVAKLLFGSQILVTTSNIDAASRGSGIHRVIQDKVVSSASVGYVGTSQADATVERKLATHAQVVQSASSATLDPLNTFQWAYRNFGFESGIAEIDTGAHAISGTGAGSIIAIATTGADFTHEDLQNALWVNADEVPDNDLDDDGNGYIDDVYGPGPLGSADTADKVGTGTALAGIIAAQRDNGIGISGIAPDAKVLACNTALPTGQMSVMDILLCVDYVIEQKTQRGQNITVFVAAFRGFSPFNQFIEPAMRALQDAEILVIAPTYMVPPGYASQDIDISTDSPSTMDFANILAVAAVDRAGQIAFKTRGIRTIDTSLPGVEILATLPGHIGVVDGSGHVDEDLTVLPAGWSLSGGWQHSVSGGVGDSGSLRLQVGSGGLSSDDQLVELPALDVSSITSGSPWFSYDLHAAGLGGWVDLEWYSETEHDWKAISSNYDRMEGPSWQRITGYLSDFHLSQVNLSALKIRFVAKTTVDHTPDFTIDNLRIGPEPVDLGFGNSYRYFNGTGAAGAIAAAMASIILEDDPGISNAGLKNKLMNSGRKLQTIIDQPEVDLDLTVTNRIAQLWNSSGTGITQCSGQLTNRRVSPVWARLNTSYRAIGQPLRVDSISSDCASAGVAPTLSELVGGRVITMSDDGLGADQVANDGLFVSEWVSDTPVKETIDISNDDQLEVYALSHYQAEERPFQWRTLLAAPQFPASHLVSPPFPLQIGGLAQGNGIESDVGIGSFPGLALDNWFVGGPGGFMKPDSPGTIRSEPTIGPRVGRFQLIPLYTRHDLRAPKLGWNVAEREVQGVAPNREWIIEWRDYSYDNCEGDNISVQMVLFENSPDVLLNFKDVATDCDGFSPRTMLLQNFESWHLFDASIVAPMSLLLRPKTAALNRAPETTGPIPQQKIVHGEMFNLDLSPYFADPDGDSMRFFLGRDSKYVNVSEIGVLTAIFPYHRSSDVPVVTIEVGAHDGYLATRSTFEVVFDNQNNQPPELPQPLPVFQGVVGEIVAFDLLQYFDDPDGDPLEVIELDSSEGMLRVVVGKELIVKASFEGQTETRDFLVTDGQLALQFSVSAVAVSIADTAPIQLMPIPDQVVRVGEYMRIPLYKFFQTDEWASISYQVTSGPSTKIYGSDPVLHGLFDSLDLANSPYTVGISAKRNGTNLVTNASFNLTILPENQPPEFAGPTSVQATQNQAVRIELENVFRDADGDDLFFVIRDLPPELQESSPGVITGTFGIAGQFAMTVRVTDELGASLVATVNIVVAAPPPPPTKKGGGGGGAIDATLLLLLAAWILLHSSYDSHRRHKQKRRL